MSSCPFLFSFFFLFIIYLYYYIFPFFFLSLLFKLNPTFLTLVVRTQLLGLFHFPYSFVQIFFLSHKCIFIQLQRMRALSKRFFFFFSFLFFSLPLFIFFFFVLWLFWLPNITHHRHLTGCVTSDRLRQRSDLPLHPYLPTRPLPRRYVHTS